MPTREEWILSQVAPTKEELYAGDGCHLDEAICLTDYLNNNITAQEAATAITKPVLQEADPQDQLCRLMALLCEAPVELAADRDKLYHLFFAIQALPPESGINWVDLPGFASMWTDLLRLGFDATDTWEEESLSDDRKTELRQHFEAVGTVEAELYLRDIGGISDIWAYEIINQVCSGRPGLDIVITGIHAWLKVAGSKLIANMKPEHIQTFSRGRRGKIVRKHIVVDTVAGFWDHWRSTCMQLSKDEEYLSAVSRRLALECHDLMQRGT
ncbi:hypothetical protein LCI18_007109 [Fusarium solani-melongenae]|uniref:Uncharacterized protein n=1 Tax=Fusarium solani subsp. cucurbitae TaxID=2747967 RepID=A0ACD3Z4I3_FUSSC|nr:hypothetical protein LCI18_007109 [Fusarium solani-melongenae]